MLVKLFTALLVLNLATYAVFSNADATAHDLDRWQSQFDLTGMSAADGYSAEFNLPSNQLALTYDFLKSERAFAKGHFPSQSQPTIQRYPQTSDALMYQSPGVNVDVSPASCVLWAITEIMLRMGLTDYGHAPIIIESQHVIESNYSHSVGQSQYSYSVQSDYALSVSEEMVELSFSIYY